MKLFITCFFTIFMMNTSMSQDYLILSQDLLYAARTNDTLVTDSLVLKLANAKIDDLKNELISDHKKKAFWLNIYNAYIQYLLKKNPEKYKKRAEFFGSDLITIAHHKFSFDDIEHGILRRSTLKWSLGYLKEWFPGKLEKSLRVDSLDYRIHFALNCGASSCPPIAFYEDSRINQQLDLAMRGFLVANSKVNKEKNRVEVSSILSWFRGDFGGLKGVKKLLLENGIIEKTQYNLEFAKYDWSLELAKYKVE